MRVKVTSKLETTPDKMFEALQKFSNVEEVMSPWLYVRPVYPERMPEKWEEGKEYVWKPFLFNLIPLGEHKIKLVKMDKDNYEALSNESGKMARVWNHRVKVEESRDGNTIYTDDVEIEAGIKAPVVWLFAHLFYRHRQKQWKKIARGL